MMSLVVTFSALYSDDCERPSTQTHHSQSQTVTLRNNRNPHRALYTLYGDGSIPETRRGGSLLKAWSSPSPAINRCACIFWYSVCIMRFQKKTGAQLTTQLYFIYSHSLGGSTFLTPVGLTHRHTQIDKQTHRQTHTHTDSFWLAILLAQSAELKRNRECLNETKKIKFRESKYNRFLYSYSLCYCTVYH